jgi:arylsulfatase A-like enzyme
VKTVLGTGLAVVAALLAGACLTPDSPEPRRERPNFLVIVADDLGYSDLGAYGSEIDTPHLDALARSGLIATDFYVAPDGGPTQAMLLSGVDHHVSGMGSVRRWTAPKTVGEPGYEERLSRGVVTVASLLRAAGYHTTMAGRWELGDDPGTRPSDRGFERSFALHDGAASHWSDMRSAIPGREQALYTQDGIEVDALPEDYYSTRYFTDFVLESIEANRADGRPFFAYLSYQAPHSPLAVPEDWRERYAGRYAEGYDAIREARLLRMKTSGLVEKYVTPYPGLPTIPAWGDLDENMQKSQSRKMELYAAMVSNLDFHVGRLLDHLREVGELDETLVVFLSDNGAEAADRGAFGMDPRDRAFYAEQFPVVDPAQWGGPGTFLEVGAAWAQVSMVPFRLFKGTLAEGGIRSPLIASGPGVEMRRGLFGLRERRPTRAVLSVIDLAPTFLELAGVDPPASWQGRPVAPMRGRSLVPLLAGEFRAREGPHEWLGFEFGGQRALRRGEWKLVLMPVPFGAGDWLLYRIDRDPAELYDRAQAHADQKRELVALWEQYARENGVVLAKPERVTEGSADETAQKSSPSDR